MPSRLKIDLDELLNLRAKGLSRQKLALHFGVTELTITRRLRKDPVNQFANQLAGLLPAAPDIYCRIELQRFINNLRTFKTSTIEEKKEKVIRAIQSEAREVDEIADDCSLSRTEALDILADLVDENKIIRLPRRKTFHYFLTVSRLVDTP